MRFKLRLLLMIGLAAVSTCALAQQTIRLSGIPDENPTELQRKYQPMVQHLEKQLGLKVQYIPVIDYGAAVSALAAGKIDFAWLGGFTFVQSKVLADARPVVMRDIDRKFKSVFIASVNSGITKPEQIRGKTFAFGSKSSTSGHLFPRYFLQKEFGIDPDKDLSGPPLFSGAHDATAKMVESGKVQAGALNIEVWTRLLENNRVDKTKIVEIWTTPEYVDYVWAARKDLPPQLVEKFAKAFLTLDVSRPADKQVLDIQGAQQFVRADPKDFDVIEQVARSTGLLK